MVDLRFRPGLDRSDPRPDEGLLSDSEETPWGHGGSLRCGREMQNGGEIDSKRVGSLGIWEYMENGGESAAARGGSREGRGGLPRVGEDGGRGAGKGRIGDCNEWDCHVTRIGVASETATPARLETDGQA